MNRTIVTLSDPRDTAHFRQGEEYLLDDGGTWRLARRSDRVRWWLRRKLRLGVYSRCAAVDHASGTVTFELVHWSWLRMKWVKA